MLRKFILTIAFAMLLALTSITDIFAESEQSSDKAYILLEMSSKTILCGENYNKRLPIGTLNKIMSALIVAEAIDNGKISLDTIVTASAYANSMKQAVIWLRENEKITVEELIKGMIIGNANDATVALAEAISGTEEKFVKLMNMKAKELNLKDTVFKNCTGYDETGQESSAYDVAVITAELLKHEWLYPIMTTWNDTVRDGKTSLVNENKLVKSLKGIVGVKAGHSEASGNCIALASNRDGICYIAVVLGADKEERFTKSADLIKKGFSSYSVGKPYVPLEALKPIMIRGGVKSEINIKTEEIKNIVIKNGSFENVKVNIYVPKYLDAPVFENTEIGRVTYTLDDNEIYSVKLLAGENTEEMTFFKALKIMVKNILKI